MLYRSTFLMVVLVALTAPALLAQEKATKEKKDDAKATSEPEFEVLFDGKSLDNFRGYAQETIGKGWKIDGDALHYDGSGGGDILSKKEYASFELHFDWKVAEGGNSGVMYRVSLGDPAPYFSGPEYQILDDEKHGDGKNTMTSSGSLYAMYAPENKVLKKAGEWNTGKIVVNGKKIEHWLNDQKVVQTEIDSESWKKQLAASKFKDWKKFGTNDKGHVCFQDHGDKVWYRNIKIRELKQ